MKKCPKCKAEIGEEARFCLFCMTSLEEKQTIKAKEENNKWWLIIIAALLVLVIAVGCIFIFAPKGEKTNSENSTSSALSVSNGSDFFVDDSSSTPEGQKGDLQDGKTPTATSSNKVQPPFKNDGIADETSTSTKGENSTSVSSASDDNKTDKVNSNTENSTSLTATSSQNSTTTSSTTTSSTTTSSPTATVTYLYRDAKYGDDFSVSANLENAVVIIGVKGVSADGKYIIPETIEGKRVLAIASLAFSDAKISNTVKTVIVPSTVKNIWGNAFANCYNLTDVYFKGDAVYTESNAFPEKSKRNGILTIHCSAKCNDRNYRYYKNSASYYDAEYKEWNG